MNVNEHAQFDQRMSESPDLSANIIGSAMDAVVATDDAQRIVLFNAAAEKIFACLANEAVGSSVERFIPQRFRAGHSARVRRFAESGITTRTFHDLGRLWGLRATGEEFPIEASISKVRSGGKVFFTVVIRDVTERYRVEETLRKSEERFRLAAQAGRMFAYEWDAATDLISRSPESAQILGINEAVPITGQQVLARVHPDDRERLTDAIATLSPEKPHLGVNYRMIRPDNTVIWLERSSCAQFDEQGKLLRIMGMVADITARHRAEEALRESEQRFRLVADTAPALMWMSGTDKLCNYFNKPWLDFTGRSMEEELGNGWAKGVHPDDLQRCLDIYTQSFDRREKFKMEYRLRHHGGDYRWILDIGVPRFNQDGSFAGYIGTCVDVTERKRAEEALREGEEQFRTLAEAIPQLCWMAHGDGHIFWYNRRWYAYTGTTAEQMEGWGWQSVHDPGTLPNVLERWKRSISSGEPFDMVFPLRGADGLFRPFLTRVMPVKDAEGRVARWFGTSTDITELRDAQESLRSSEERLRLAQWAAHIGTFDLNLRTGVDIWPPETEALYGLPPGGFGGTLTAFEDLIHPNDRERITELTQEMMRTGQPAEAEWRVVWPDGSVHWIASRGQVLMDESGEPSRMLGVNIDVTERKRTEEALVEMTRKLVEAQEQERARIARELHDDINQRLGLLAIKLEQLQNDPSEVRSRVQELAKQTTDISNDIQALSHDLHSSQLEYLGVVKGIRGWCREFGERHGMQIDYRHDVRSTLPQDIGLCLFRVLQEALHNAAKHSGVKRIEVQLHEESSEIHLIVSDKGRGFNAEAVNQGKGLGLTSMRERVRLVRGAIEIESKPMGGATIRVRVPFKSEHDAQRAAV